MTSSIAVGIALGLPLTWPELAGEAPVLVPGRHSYAILTPGMRGYAALAATKRGYASIEQPRSYGEVE